MGVDNRRTFDCNRGFFVTRQVRDRWLVKAGSSVDVDSIDHVI